MNSTVITPTPLPAAKKRLGVPSQLLHHNTTTVNQVLGLPGMFSTFVARDLRNLRILALTASSASIVACAISIFYLVNIDKRRRVFRHDLIFFLIICDLVKALVLMIYPLVILVRNEVYAQPGFYNTLGWFTAYCVEGADLAIFFFAIHFALLIFIPSWKWRHRGSGRMEGGLYCVRAYIWPITALVPVLLASLAFVNFELIDEAMLRSQTTVVLDNDNYHFPYYARLGGYKPYSAWCYLPPYPVWYKLVLSWGPRYFLIVSILVLYISIYVFVRRESNKIKDQIFEFKEKRQQAQELKTVPKAQALKVMFNRFIRRPFMHSCVNVVNFLSFSFDDSSSSARGASSLCSSRSFYATDDSTSSDQVPDVRMTVNYPSSMEGEKTGPLNNEQRRRSIFDSWGSINRFGGSRRESQIETPPEVLEAGLGQPPEALVSETSAAKSLNEQSRPPGHACLSPIQSLVIPSCGEQEVVDLGGMNDHNISGKTSQNLDTDLRGIQASFQKQTYAAMKRRRAQIQKNLRSIFIYPFSYIAIWIFPLIVDITQYHYEVVHGPIVWLVYIATIAQPLNGLVDTLVFVYREKPWRCSWKVVQTKELLDSYSLKGGLGEKDISKLYHSDLGKKGWYYCSRFNKFSCWKHKPQKWKRAAWYVHKFLQGLLANDYNFEDHCDELALRHNDCVVEGRPRSSNTLKIHFDQQERQVSFPSDSTTASVPPANYTLDGVTIEHVNVSSFWRFIHLLPMLHGIDLDELNRELRRKSDVNDFVLPGLRQALDKKSACGTGKNDKLTPPIFKPGYTVAKEREGLRKHQDESAQPQPSHVDLVLSANLDFSDVVRGESPGAVEQDARQSPADSREGDKMGMLAFLNDLMH